MYQEFIAKYTADHLREHIPALLAAQDALHTGNDKVTLIVPRTITVASEVGGQFAEFDKILPIYAVDCIDKRFLAQGVDQWTYEYDGHIGGLVSANSQQTVDKLVKRHAAACEKFVRTHLNLHLYEDNVADFGIGEFSFVSTGFSGAEQVTQDAGVGTDLWMAGFVITVVWGVIEGGPSNESA